MAVIRQAVGLYDLGDAKSLHHFKGKTWGQGTDLGQVNALES